MKKTLSIYEILPLGIIIVSAIVSLWIYPLLPQEVPSHWNSEGIIDAWMNKNMAVLLFPMFTFITYLIMVLLPFADPYYKNYSKFAVHYFWYRTSVVLFFIMAYLFSLWVAMGLEMNIIYFIVPILSLFIMYNGFFMTKVKRNYFIGVRTPWTLHSEKIWDKTHEFGGRVIVATGMISLLSMLSVKYAFIIFISIVVIGFCIPSAYSYFIFKKEK